VWPGASLFPKGDTLSMELTFPSNLIAALTILFAVCILVPTMYYVWNVYKKKLSHTAIIGGLCCFFLFGYWFSGLLLGSLAPESRMQEMGMWSYSLIRALCVSISEIGGMTLLLWFLHRSQRTIRVPIGFCLGFRLFDFFYLGAMNTVIRLSYAMTVNQDGVDAVLSQVDAEQVPALRLQMEALAESSPATYWMSAVDYICMFALSAALSRLIWYALEGGKKPEDKRMIPLCFALRFLCEAMLALDASGGSYRLCAAVYYVLVAGSVCLAFYVSRQRDDPELLHAEHLKERVIKRRRY